MNLKLFKKSSTDAIVDFDCHLGGTQNIQLSSTFSEMSLPDFDSIGVKSNGKRIKSKAAMTSVNEMLNSSH